MQLNEYFSLLLVIRSFFFYSYAECIVDDVMVLFCCELLVGSRPSQELKFQSVQILEEFVNISMLSFVLCGCF